MADREQRLRAMFPVLLAIVLAGVSFTVRAGDVWTALAPPEQGLGWCLDLDPFDPRTLYASADNTSIAKSTDGGASWAVLELDAYFLKQIAVEPSASGRVTVLSTGNGKELLHRTIDGGITWKTQAFSTPHPGLLWQIAVDPSNRNVIYGALGVVCWITCVDQSGGVMKSIDGGARWQSSLKGVDIEEVAIDPSRPATVYAVGERLERSDDAGRTWITVPPPASSRIMRVAFDPLIPTALYATTVQGGLWRSDDRGGHWQLLGNTTTDARPARSVAVDPTAGETIVVSVGSGAVRSTDGGATWAALDDGLLDTRYPPQLIALRRVVFGSDGRLYASSNFAPMKLVAGPVARRRSARH